MKLFKKISTYFSMLVIALSGTSFNSIASEGEEGAEAFDDPNAPQDQDDDQSSIEESAPSSSPTATAGSAATGSGSGS